MALLARSIAFSRVDEQFSIFSPLALVSLSRGSAARLATGLNSYALQDAQYLDRRSSPQPRLGQKFAIFGTIDLQAAKNLSPFPLDTPHSA
jgi:hypothetical protein